MSKRRIGYSSILPAGKLHQLAFYMSQVSGYPVQLSDG